MQTSGGKSGSGHVPPGLAKAVGYGTNAWVIPDESDAAQKANAPQGKHAYLVKHMPREDLARVIEDLMVRQP